MQIKSQETISNIQQKLLSWYREHHRILPFRNTNQPYEIWVSEVMLQQTQVKTVLPFYEKFIRLFPTVQALGDARIEKVLKAWEGLGYYARARNLLKSAKEVVAHHGGVLPQTHQELLNLPGIGNYIAAAILSIAFGKPYAVVDGNVKRVYARIFLMDEAINVSSSLKIYQSLSDRLLDKKNPGDYNQAVMELGALICTPLNPKCQICPVKPCCMAFGKNAVSDYPKKIKRKKVPQIKLAGALILIKGRLLAVQRKEEGLLGGLWEFPNYEIKEFGVAEEILKLRIKEHLGIRIERVRLMGKVNHVYTHFKAQMALFACDIQSGEISLNGPVNYSWILPEEIKELPFSKINHKLFPMVTKYLKELKKD